MFPGWEVFFKLVCHLSIHLYTGFGPRDRTQVEREYGRSVYGPDAAEYSIEIAKGLINKAVRPTSFISWLYADLTLPCNNQRISKQIAKPIKLAFDEYGVWDETVGTLPTSTGTCLTLPHGLTSIKARLRTVYNNSTRSPMH